MILGVNIDHIATLRQARMGADPDPLMAAPLAVLGGADGITVHLREDRRHINDRDLRLLKETVPVELNLEMAATAEMLRIASALRPDMATLVPEKRAELTTEGGLDLKRQNKKLQIAIKKLHGSKIPVSLFINPDPSDVDASRELGADMVEIHTGRYADALTPKAREREFRRVLLAVEHGLESGITVNAGHGLNYYNVKPVAAINGIRGLYIGHSIISRAVLVGLERAVMEMKALISEVAL
ncbi:MAG: pyridoxine 5'-phosphate synthase [Thermodesulfovibrionales bacterium]|nr:pyridoxine 5'-phosphate synthase [Thermodesulfovibrionales bacterium]